MFKGLFVKIICEIMQANLGGKNIPRDVICQITFYFKTVRTTLEGENHRRQLMVF